MGRPSKFTAERRRKVLELLMAGASRRTAATCAGIGHQTLARWIQRGETATEGSPWREFHYDVLEAEAHPKIRALSIVYNAMEDRPDLAWKFVERQVDGFAPRTPGAAPPPESPGTIQLHFGGGNKPPSFQIEAHPTDCP
jgi:hypothetical protein